MNVLIIADKSNGKIYTEVINKAPNTKVIGIINSISDSFISDLGNKYTPNVVILDTAVENNNNFPAVTQTIGRTYSFVKIIVLAEANDNRDFPSAAYVVRGSISSKNIIDMLSDINRKYNTPHDDIDGSVPTENLQNKVFQRQAPPNLDVKVKKVKPKKQKAKIKRKSFKLNPLYLLPVVVLVVIVTIGICIKAYNGNHSQEDVSDNSIAGTSAEITTDVPATTQYSATIATVAEYSEYSNYNNSEPDTVPYSPKSVNTETSKIESNHNDGKSSNGNDKSSSSNQSNNSGSKSNNNNSNNSGGSHSYVTVSKPEYNYSHNEKTDIEVSGITLNYLSKTLTAGESINLSATVTPSNATDKSISWSTSNSSVATVSNGYVVSHSAGTAYITASANGHSATCTVIVKEKETQDSVYIAPSTKYCEVNEVVTFTLVNAKSCSFSISNPSAVQIIGAGSNRIQLRAKAKATITVTAKNTSTGKEYSGKLIIE